MAQPQGYGIIGYGAGGYGAIAELSITLSDSVGSSDTFASVDIYSLLESILLADSLTQSTVGITLSDSIRLNDWLSKKKSKSIHNPWYN